MIEQILSPKIIDALGWTLIHALWQGALFALMLGVLLILLKRYSSQARYLVSVGLLAGFFVTVAFTFGNLVNSSAGVGVRTNQDTSNELARLDAPDEPEHVDDSEEVLPPSTSDELIALEASDEPTELEGVSIPWLDQARDYFNRHIPLLVTLWLLGVLVLQLRFLGQLAFVQRMKNYGVQRFPSSWAGKIQELEEALDIRRPVRYLVSRRALSPLTVGWLRPAVIFPDGMLDQLRESQVATILAHELAHIKRHDFIVNVLQNFLTTFFFFHPGVWWMSTRIEEEREHACDDLAIAATGGRIDYAKTLIQLKENQMTSPQLSMALAGRNGGFTYRIKRLLSGYLGSATYGEGIVTTLILVATLGLALSLTGQTPDLNHGGEQLTQIEESGEAGEMSSLSQENLPSTPAYPSPLGGEVQSPRTDGADDSRQLEPAELDLVEQEAIAWSDVDLGNLSAEEELRLLVRAIRQGDEGMFRYFLNRVRNLNQAAGPEENYFTPLMAAASEDQVGMLEALLERGADVNYVNGQGWTALIEAADEGSYRSAQLLLAAGADPNLKGRNTYRSAISMAASEGFPEIMELLLGAGADIDYGFPLHEAAEEGQLEIVRLLVEKGVNVNELDDRRRTPLARAASEDNPSVVRYLIGQGAEPELGTYLPLHLAAEDGKVAAIRALLEAGANVNARDGHRRTALICAASDGHHTAVSLLLDAGAEINAQDAWGNTALIAAADDNHQRVVRQLLQAGANTDMRTDQGQNALEIALSEGSEDAVDELTADLAEYALDNLRNSPQILIGPAREGHLFMVRQMLETGIDINITDDRGHTALSVAANEGHQGIVDYLLSRGAEIRGGACGPVAEAVQEGHVDVLNRLLEYGADLDVLCSFRNLTFRNNYGAIYHVGIYEGATLLIQAVEEENIDVIRRLLELGVDPNEYCTKRRFSVNGELDWGQANTMSVDQLRQQADIQYEIGNWTALMEAVETGSIPMIGVLIEGGADPEPARELARQSGDTRIIELLR
ncbi:MAG: ankyrin repeat domain-containing protein [Bacteroidota bacterium]